MIARVVRRAAGIVLAGVALLCLGALSRVTYDSGDSGSATLRLSWRVRGHHVDKCHRLTAAELERLPAHMRRAEVCEGYMAPYILSVRVDGVLLDSAVAAPAGARRDRPVYVFRELRLTPGTHDIKIGFVSTATEVEAHAPGSDPVTDIDAPAHLQFTSSMKLGVNDVVLVTYDPESGGLVARRKAPAGD